MKSGVYHIKTAFGKYTGSAKDLFRRLFKDSHPKAQNLLKQAEAEVTLTPVDVSDVAGAADKGRALKVVEQNTMTETGNVPGADGSLNSQRALTDEKLEKYKKLIEEKKD